MDRVPDDKKLRKYLKPLFEKHCATLDPNELRKEYVALGGRDFSTWTGSSGEIAKCIDKIFNVRSQDREWVIEHIRILDVSPDPRFVNEPIHMFMPASTVDTSQSAEELDDDAVSTDLARKRGRSNDGSEAPAMDFAAMADENAEQVRKLQNDLDHSRAHAGWLMDELGKMNVAFQEASKAATTAQTYNASAAADIRNMQQQVEDLKQQLESQNDVTAQLKEALAQAQARQGQCNEAGTSKGAGSRKSEETAEQYIARKKRENKIKKDNLILAKIAHEAKVLNAVEKQLNKDVTQDEIDKVVEGMGSYDVDETEDMDGEQEREFLRRSFARMMGPGYESD